MTHGRPSKASSETRVLALRFFGRPPRRQRARRQLASDRDCQQTASPAFFRMSVVSDSDAPDITVLSTTSELTPPPDPLPKSRVYIELSLLDPAERDTYEDTFPFPASAGLTSNSTAPLEVIGEYKERDTLFYFAKHPGGLAHKVGTGAPLSGTRHAFFLYV